MFTARPLGRELFDKTGAKPAAKAPGSAAKAPATVAMAPGSAAKAPATAPTAPATAAATARYGRVPSISTKRVCPIDSSARATPADVPDCGWFMWASTIEPSGAPAIFCATSLAAAVAP